MSNTLTVTGNLGEDAKLTYTQNGKAVLSFSVADDDSRKLPSGEWETVGTTWWNCQLWEQKAEAAADVLVKGARVIVTGRAKLREYETRDGAKGTSLDVRVQDVAVIPKPDRNPAPAQQRPAESDQWGQTEPPPF